MDAPLKANWRKLHSGPGIDQYHAATLPLVLHRKETMSYRVNLANGEPSIYVVLREDPESGDSMPVTVHTVTASPFEAQAHSNLAFDTVDRVPMPDRLVELVQAFIDDHHVDEKFAKRQRQPHLREEDHQFGQEPIFMLRERMKGLRPKSGPGDDL